MKTIIEMAHEVYGANTKWTDAQLERLNQLIELVRADERNSWPAEMEAMERQVNILTDALTQAKADEREAIYKMVLLDTLKDPDLLMPESEVDDNDADDYFKSSEFRYAMNNVVKSTIFTITANIRARGNT